MDVDHSKSGEVESTPRINSARMGDYQGRTVRLVCKVTRVSGKSAVVQASDHGQIDVRSSTEGEIEGTYVEIVGQVVDPSTIKMFMCTNLGSELDLDMVNDCIEIAHKPLHAAIF